MSEVGENAVLRKRDHSWTPDRKRKVAHVERKTGPFTYSRRRAERHTGRKILKAIATAGRSAAVKGAFITGAVGATAYGVYEGISQIGGEPTANAKAPTAATIQLPENSTIVNPGIRQEYDWEKESDTFDVIFHDVKDAKLADARERVREMEEMVDNNPIYEKMTKIIPDYMDDIVNAAKENNVPVKSLIAHLVLEGGEKDKVSDAGAVGIAQFKVAAAIESGLIVDPSRGIDQRLNPVKSIHAMAYHLSNLRNLFGDQGLADVAYNWGAGRMLDALRVHVLSRTGKDYGSGYLEDSANATQEEENTVKEAVKKYKKFIEDNHLTALDLINDADVVNGVLAAGDIREAKIYPPGLVAAADHFEEGVKTGKIKIPQKIAKNY